MGLLNFVFNVFKDNNRIKYFEDYSKKYNYNFTKNTETIPINIPFELFTKGTSVKTSSIIKGIFDNYDFLLCDFEKTILSSGGKKTNKKQTILIFNLKKKLNNFILKPKYTLNNEELKNSKNIIENSNFSAVYNISCNNAENIQKIFSNEILYFFNQLKYISAEVYEDKLLFYVDNLLLELNEEFLTFFISNGIRLVKLLNIQH